MYEADNDISSYAQVQVSVALAAVSSVNSDASSEESDGDGIYIQYALDANTATSGDVNVNTEISP